MGTHREPDYGRNLDLDRVRTWRSLVGRALAVAAFLVLVAAQPAAAETTVDVTTAADGFYQPGKPTTLLVSVTADQAMTGTIEVGLEGEVGLAPSVAIEVPGGSTKTFAVPVEFPPWDDGVQVVVRTSDGDTSRVRPNLRPAMGVEPIGVMPSLAAPGIPDRVDLVAENRQGTIVVFDPGNLEYGVAVLNGFSALLATEADLASLSTAQLEVVRAWVATGGRLVMDGSSDDVPASLADLDFEPSVDAGATLARAWSGLGSVLLVGDSLANGRLDGLVTPRFASGQGGEPMPFPMEAEMGFNEGGVIIEDLAADAGFRTRPIGAYVAVLLAYIALIGPIMWLVLARSRRETAIWVLVPALAALFSVGVWGAGLLYRQVSTGSHVTVVGDIAGSSFTDTTYLMSSASGGTIGIELGEGWSPSAASSDPWDWRLRQANLPTLELVGQRLTADVPPAGLVLAAAVQEDLGRAEPSWAVDGSYVDGQFEGTAVNNTGTDLTEVFMVIGGAVRKLDDAPAGGSVSFAVRSELDGGPFVSPIPGRFSQPGGAGNADSPPATLRWLLRHTSASSTDFIIGWTGDAAAPLDTVGGDGVGAGRTGYLSVLPAASHVSAQAALAPGTPVGARVAVTESRWSGEPGASLVGSSRDNIVEGQVTTFSIELPPGLDDEIPLSVRVSDAAAAMDIWNGTQWLDSGLGLLEPRTGVDVAVPPGSVRGDEIRLRMLSDYPGAWPIVVVSGQEGS